MGKKILDISNGEPLVFEKRKVKKTYHAISHGIHTFDNFLVNLPLVTTRSGRSAVNKQKGKPSQTTFDTLENFTHFSLISCSPVSGRQHQIRIHLASQNAPIAADEIYGGELPFLSNFKKKFNLKKGSEEQPMINRFALHAYSLNFQDMDGTTLDIMEKNIIASISPRVTIAPISVVLYLHTFKDW